MSRLIFSLLIALICLWASSSAQADSYEGVLHSNDMKKMQRITHAEKSRQNALARHQGPPSDPTNYETLFVNSKSIQPLLSWIAWKLDDYERFDAAVRAGTDLIQASSDYINKATRKHYTFRILLPRPDKLYQKEMGLIIEFKHLEPPYLSIVGSEEIEIGGIKATLYQQPKFQCSILIQIEREGVLNIESKDCRDIKELLEFAGKLDIERLNRKLLS